MNVEFKTITFEYQNKEEHFIVHRNLPYRELLKSIKNVFNLPDDIGLTFRLPDTNTNFLPLTTADLWTLSTEGVPKYQLVTRNDNVNVPTGIHGSGFWNQLYDNFIVRFLVVMLDFALNALAGVVASAIFIENRSLLYGRIFICIGFIILFKFLSTKYMQKRTLNSWFEFLLAAQPAPPIPTGRRLS